MGVKVESIRDTVAIKTRTYFSRKISIPGITAAAAHTAADALGVKFIINTPRSGILYSANLWDLDDEGLQIDLALFSADFTAVADDAAWSLSDEDLRKLFYVVKFQTFDDAVNGQMSSVEAINKAVVLPEGQCWAQAIARGASTIAAGSDPVIQLQFLADDI